MDISQLTDKECREWRRKRHSYFTEIVSNYTSFNDFIRDWDERLFLMGVQLMREEGYVRLYIQFDFYEYEEFHVVMGEDGHLRLSNGVGFEEMCANMIGDIATGEYLEDYPEGKRGDDG